MVAVVLTDDRLLTWRAPTDDAKAVLWDAAGGRVVAALQHLSKIDGAVPVAVGTENLIRAGACCPISLLARRLRFSWFFSR